MKKKRGNRRRLVFALGTVVAVCGVLFTGWPQRVLVESVASAALGAPVKIEWGGFLGDLRLKSFRVYDPENTQTDEAPVVQLSGLRIDYNLFSERRIRSVVINDMRVHADLTDPDHPNYEFILDLLEGDPSSDDSMLPENMSIEHLAGSVALPDGQLSIAELSAAVTLESTEKIDIALDSRNAEIEGQIGTEQTPFAYSNALVKLESVLRGEVLSADFWIDVPGFVQLTGSSDYGLSDSRMTLEIESLDADGQGVGEIASSIIPFDIAFDEARVKRVSVEVVPDSEGLPLISGEWDVDGLVLGDPTNVIYAGDVRVAVASVEGETEKREVAVIFQDGPELHCTFTGNQTTGEVDVSFVDWAKDEFASVVPSALRPLLDPIAFSTAAGTLEGNWSEDTWQASVQIGSKAIEGSSSSPLLIALELNGSTDKATGIEGSVEAWLDDNVIQATAYYGDDGEYNATAMFESVQMAPWAQFILQTPIDENASTIVTGTIEATAVGPDAPLLITPALVLSELQYGDATLERVEVSGNAQLTADFDQVKIERIHAEADDYTTEFTISNWLYSLESQEGEGKLEGALDLALLGALTGQSDLYGEATWNAQVEIRNDALRMPFHFSADPGVGDLAVPYGTKLIGDGTLIFDSVAGDGAIESFVATLGEGSRLEAASTQFVASPFSAHGEMDMISDLQILVDMGWFELAKGEAREKSPFEIREGALFFDWDITFEADHLKLPDDAASVSGVAFTASGSYDDGLQGSGKGRIAEMSVAGGTARDIEGPATIEGEVMRFSGATARLFDGDVEGNLDVGILQEGMPIKFRATVHNINLATMTEEVQPPKTQLTGIADGTFSADYSLEGLQDMDLDVSSATNLSLNKSLVAEMLQTDALMGESGSKIAKKMLSKFLGSAPQRPFDGGRLHVYLIDDTIQGVAELRSVKTKDYNGLNLTVNLDMDQSALEQALKLLEESDLANVEF